MYVDPQIAKMYRNGISPRIAAQISGRSFRRIVHDYNEMARLCEMQGVINENDLKVVCAEQVKVELMNVCVSGTTDPVVAQRQSSAAYLAFAERDAIRRNSDKGKRINMQPSTIFPLPVSLEYVYPDPLGKQIERLAERA